MAAPGDIYDFVQETTEAVVAHAQRAFERAAHEAHQQGYAWSLDEARAPRDAERWGWAVYWDNGASASGTFSARYLTEADAETAADGWVAEQVEDGNDEAGAEAIFVGDRYRYHAYTWFARQFARGVMGLGFLSDRLPSQMSIFFVETDKTNREPNWAAGEERMRWPFYIVRTDEGTFEFSERQYPQGRYFGEHWPGWRPRLGDHHEQSWGRITNVTPLPLDSKYIPAWLMFALGNPSAFSGEATPEARLGFALWKLGRDVRLHIEDAFDVRSTMLTTNQAQERQRRVSQLVIEAVRVHLNWPRLPADYDPPPPSQWPEPEE